MAKDNKTQLTMMDTLQEKLRDFTWGFQLFLFVLDYWRYSMASDKRSAYYYNSIFWTFLSERP